MTGVVLDAGQARCTDLKQLLHERQLRGRNDRGLLVAWVRLTQCAASIKTQRNARDRGALATSFCDKPILFYFGRRRLD